MRRELAGMPLAARAALGAEMAGRTSQGPPLDEAIQYVWVTDCRSSNCKLKLLPCHCSSEQRVWWWLCPGLELFLPVCLGPMLQAVKSLLTPQPTSAPACGAVRDPQESSAKGSALSASALVHFALRKQGRGERGGMVTQTQGSWLAPEL